MNNIQVFMETLPVMLFGMIGIFLVIIFIYIFIEVFMRITKEKKDV